MKCMFTILLFSAAYMMSTATSLGDGRDAETKDSDWKSAVARRLPELGHRNWIVIADSAYPAQTRDGIETIVTHESQLSVVKTVLQQLARAKHIRPVVYLDKELNYVPESDAPGIEAYRRDVKDLLGTSNPKQMPHEKILEKLDKTGAQFKVLVLKTDLTLPYTSVFFELDCRYWSADAETRLRDAMRNDSK